MITVLDSAVFQKTSKIIEKNNPGYRNRGVAGFEAKRLFFRILGCRDVYMIFLDNIYGKTLLRVIYRKMIYHQ